MTYQCLEVHQFVQLLCGTSVFLLNFFPIGEKGEETIKKNKLKKRTVLTTAMQPFPDVVKIPSKALQEIFS